MTIMFKMIFQNLRSHRRTYFWLLLELVLVACVAWLTLDPAIVSLYSMSADKGYDHDRLVKISLAKLPDGESESEISAEEAAAQDAANVERILARLTQDERVEASTLVNYAHPEGSGMGSNGIQTDNEDVYFNYMVIGMADARRFFETFGIYDATTGNVPQAVPSSTSDVFISQMIADYLFPGENPVGHYMEEKSTKDFDLSKDNQRIIGVVKDAVYRSDYLRTPIVYNYSPTDFNINNSTVSIVLRLKPGVDVDEYISDIAKGMTHRFMTGKIYPKEPRSFNSLVKWYSRDNDNKVFIYTSVAIFFLISVLFGIAGSFYLQTRSRSEDTGIMRTFGATPRFIVAEMLGEGFVLVTVACILGFALFALFGLDSMATTPGFNGDAIASVKPIWCDSKLTHFAIISVVIYVIMLIVVAIGIYVPARNISRVNPIDALREE